RPELLAAGLPAIEDLRLGGHDIRAVTLLDGALEIYRRNGSIRYETIDHLRGDLDEIDREIRPGILVNSGEAIEKMRDDRHVRRVDRLEAAVAAVRADIESFRERCAPDGVVLVNLASTEPPLALDPAVHRDPDAIRSALRANAVDKFRSS